MSRIISTKDLGLGEREKKQRGLNQEELAILRYRHTVHSDLENGKATIQFESIERHSMLALDMQSKERAILNIIYEMPS